MSKEFTIYYSQQADGFIPGQAYGNPRFFSTPRAGVTKVYLVGDWPDIRAAYENLGVPVERLDASAAEQRLSNIPLATAPANTAADDPGSVVIPDGWEALHWKKVRALANAISAVPVKNGDEAAEVINAELARRAAVDAPVDPLDVPQPTACGLTLRELHADLTALGVHWAPDATPAQLLAERDEARMLAEAG